MDPILPKGRATSSKTSRKNLLRPRSSNPHRLFFRPPAFSVIIIRTCPFGLFYPTIDAHTFDSCSKTHAKIFHRSLLFDKNSLLQQQPLSLLLLDNQNSQHGPFGFGNTHHQHDSCRVGRSASSSQLGSSRCSHGMRPHGLCAMGRDYELFR